MRLKRETLHSTKFRKSAMGEECTLQIPGVCNGNPETTVLAHTDVLDESGMGLKCGDDSAVYACSGCHDLIDRRVKWRDFDELDWYRFVSKALVLTHRRMRAKGLKV